MNKIVAEIRTDEGIRFFRGGCCGTLRTTDAGGDKVVIELEQKDNLVLEPHFRVRKLTPKECWRLMGFSDEDFDKAKAALNKQFYKGADRSNSQMYKQAGNSIVVNVLESIFKMMVE